MIPCSLLECWGDQMDRIAEVEAAKKLMNEAISWSVMKWLTEKKQVRKAADQANALLDEANRSVKASWTMDLKRAYESLNATTGSGSKNGFNATTLQTAKKIKLADEEAYRARLDAEQTFDKAEKQLSTALAREGCKKAILSWELHEKAILTAGAILPSK